MNVIELVTKYLPLLDEQYVKESRTSILDVNPAFVQDTKDAKKVKIAKMNVDGLADYSRNDGFTNGAMDLTWEEHEFTVDRGRALQVDDMDNEETFGLAFGRLAGEFQRTKVVPEIDAYRLSKYYNKALYKKDFTVTAGAILEEIDNMDAYMDEAEVPENDRILFVNPEVFKLMMNDPTLSKRITVNGTEDKTVNKKFYYYNDHLIIKVPSVRFQTHIKLLDGKTHGEEAGGYALEADSKAIGILMVAANTVIQLSKRRIARLWAPTREQAAGADGVNPNADAWRFDFRIYHDAWVLDNKIQGLAAATIANAEVTGVTITSEDTVIGGNAATVSLAGTGGNVMLNADVVATGGAAETVEWKTSDRTVAVVNENGKVKLKKTGSVKITATSVWDASQSDYVNFTVNA